MIDINQQKRTRIEWAVKIVALLGIGFLVAPFIFVAIQGLVGLLAALAVSYTTIQFIPWLALKISNWRLKAIKWEAGKNPIETLQNDYQKRSDALSDFKDSIQSFIGEVATFKDKLDGFKKKYPSESQKFDDQYSKMTQLLNIRKDKFEEAKDKLNEYSDEIKKASAIYDMAQAAIKMNKAAGLNEDDIISKIESETALDSVQKNLNMAFSDLEVSLLDEHSNPPTNLVNSATSTNKTKNQRTVLN